MTSEKKREPSFEKDLEGLEKIVNALEEGGLPLEESLKQFEAGIRLTRKCETALRDAERKIEILTKSMNGTLEAQPFDEEQAEGPATSTRATRKSAAPPPPPPPEEEPEEPPFDTDDDLEDLF